MREVLGDRQPGVGGGVLGDEADPAELGGAVAGTPPSTSMVPDVGASNPTARWSRVVLPAPLGPTRPTTLPSGMASAQSRSAQRRPYRLPSPFVSIDGGHATPSAKQLRTAVR